MRRTLLAVLAVGLVGASGCSGDTSTPPLSGAAARQLQADVLAVTVKSAAHDWTAARANLDKLRADLAAAKSAGTVTPARVAAIEAAVAAVSSDLAAAAASASTPPVVPSSSTPVPLPSTPKPEPKPRKTKDGDG